MNKLYYNVSLRPLRHLLLGHQYDHNNLTIQFEGFARIKDDSTIYVKMGSPIEAMVPLSDANELVVQNYMTKESTRGIPCQIVEYALKNGGEGVYELINGSKVFYACVDESVAEGEIPEVTDPSLDLIYTQMHEMYLTIKNAYESGEFKGADGHTPIKGTDYWTDIDKQEIVDDSVKELQPTLDEKANKEHIHDYDDIGDKTSTLSNRLEDIEGSVNKLYTGTDALSVEISNRYTKSETYSQEEVNDLISKIPKFAIGVVTVLPTADISETTIYLLKTSETETDNLYTEYIYVDSKWEMLGTQKLDLSGYYTATEVDNLLTTEKTGRQNADSELENQIANTNSKKVGYQEVSGNTLYMYADDTKAVLLATLELPAAPVQDVQINGTSIIDNGG